MKARILQGFRDFLSEDMIPREEILTRIKKTIERYGYDPLQTPTLEYSNILESKSGEEARTLMYKFKDKGDRNVSMKYDLTVPTARVVAMNKRLLFPFKRYQNQFVWRADKPQRGRYREFMQFDFDVYGTNEIAYDAEILFIIHQVFVELGFDHFIMKVNHRKLLNAIVAHCEMGSDIVDVLQILDKIEKIGQSSVRSIYIDKGYNEESVDKFLSIVGLSRNSDNLETIDSLKSELSSDDAIAAINDLENIFSLLSSYGVPSRRIKFDISLARGLDYYTGPVHEIIVVDPHIGSLCGGGRYDKLVNGLGGDDVPATGTSLGIERIIDTMKALGMVSASRTTSKVLMCNDEHVSNEKIIEFSSMLRDKGINVEVYWNSAKLAKQYKYADTKGIPYVIVQLKDSDDLYNLKNMSNGEQLTLKAEEIIENLIEH